MQTAISKFGLFAAGAALTIMALVPIGESTVSADSVQNSPDVVRTPTNTPVPGATNPPRPNSTNTPTSSQPTQVPSQPYANILIGNTSSPSLIPVGGDSVFTIGLRCDGNVPCNDVVVYDTLPSFMTVISVAPERAESSSGSGQNITVRVGQVRQMEVLNITVVARAIAAGSAFNEVRVTASNPDNPNDNYARAPIAATGPQPIPPPTPTPQTRYVVVDRPVVVERPVTKYVYVPLPRTGDEEAAPSLPLLAVGLITMAAGVVARRRK